MNWTIRSSQKAWLKTTGALAGSFIGVTAATMIVARMSLSMGFSPIGSRRLGLVAFFIYAGKPIGFGGKGKDLRLLPILGALALMTVIALFSIASYALFINNTNEAVERREMLQARALASAPIQRDPRPIVLPEEIRMGSWQIVVPPGEWSEWIEFIRNKFTHYTISSTALCQKGKRLGREIVATSEPPRAMTPSDNWKHQKGEAIRFYSGAETLVVKITRSYD
jgi:hypothetical protein